MTGIRKIATTALRTLLGIPLGTVFLLVCLVLLWPLLPPRSRSVVIAQTYHAGMLELSNIWTKMNYFYALNNVLFADQFSGADACVKIKAAIAVLPATGGTVDARGLQGTQSCSVDARGTATMPFRLLLGAGTLTMTVAPTTLSDGSEIVGLGPGSTIIVNNTGNPTFKMDNSATAQNTDAVRISNLKINSTTTGSDGIYFNNVHSWVVDRVEWHGDNTNGVGLRVLGSFNGSCYDSQFWNGSIGIYVADGTYSGGNVSSNAINFIRCQGLHSNLQGTLITNTLGVPPLGISFFGGSDESNNQEGMRIIGSASAVGIYGRYFESNGLTMGTPVQLQIGTTVGRVREVTVQNCFFNNGTGNHISVDAASNVAIGFNRHMGTVAAAIKVTANTNVVTVPPAYRLQDGSAPTALLTATGTGAMPYLVNGALFDTTASAVLASNFLWYPVGTYAGINLTQANTTLICQRGAIFDGTTLTHGIQISANNVTVIGCAAKTTAGSGSGKDAFNLGTSTGWSLIDVDVQGSANYGVNMGASTGKLMSGITFSGTYTTGYYSGSGTNFTAEDSVPTGKSIIRAQSIAINAGMSDPTSPVDGSLWYRSDVPTFNSRLAGTTRAVVTDTATQTLTNKTLTSPALTSPSADLYKTATNCSSSASPAVCGSASAGSFVIAAATTSVVVNTTAVTANSQISLTEDSSLGTKLAVTCNTQSLLVLGIPKVTARVAATSFTAAIEVGPTTNPLCVSYQITN